MSRVKIFCTAGLLLAGVVAPLRAQVPDGVSFEYGVGQSTRLVRGGAQWNWERQWLISDSYHLGGYWDLTLANWALSRPRNLPGTSRHITDIGLTPVFRYQPNLGKGVFYEAGIGVHRLSELYDNDGHQLATKFQFGDHLAIGYAFGPGWEVSAKLQHFSNGGIKHPNGGVNYIVARIAKQF